MWDGVNWYGLLGCTSLMLLVITAVCGTSRFERLWSKPEPPRSNMIDSSKYVAPDHFPHIVDLERSIISVRHDGSVMARCAMQGCGVVMLIGRNVANAVVVEEPN